MPLRGTEATSHDTLLAWHDEWSAATLAYRAASADKKAADSTETTTEEKLCIAIRALNIARSRESKANASYSVALKRLRTAKDKYQQLLDSAHSDAPSTPSPLASDSRMPRGKGKSQASTSDGEDEADDFEGDIFEGFSSDMGDIGGVEVEETHSS